MSTYGSWTEDDLERVLTALRNGDATLNAIAKAYGVRNRLSRGISTAATNTPTAARNSPVAHKHCHLVVCLLCSMVKPRETSLNGAKYVNENVAYNIQKTMEGF